VKEAARKQKGLIRSAFAALKPGGELLYCTCSFAAEENELIVAHLLQAEPAADLLPVTERGGPGLTAWQGRVLDDRLSLTRRILPDDLWDGFFLARLVKRQRSPG
jgi:16S rRNA (cytosine1407-C5)-methyltransferase